MSMQDVKKIIKNKVTKLGEEVSRLVQEREECVARIKQIDTRLDQLAGAISELNKLLIELQNCEGEDA